MFLTFPEEKTQTNTAVTTYAFKPLSFSTSQSIDFTSSFNSAEIQNSYSNNNRMDTTAALTFFVPDVNIENNFHELNSSRYVDSSTRYHNENSTDSYNFSSIRSNSENSFHEAQINGTTLKIDTFEESSSTNHYVDSTDYDRNNVNSSHVKEISNSTYYNISVFSLNLTTRSSEIDQTESTLALNYNQTTNEVFKSTMNLTAVNEDENLIVLTTHQEINLKNQTNNSPIQIYVSSSTTSESVSQRQI